MTPAGMRALVVGLDRPEGLAMSPTGEVWAGGVGGQLYRLDVTSGTAEQVATTGGTLLGICVDGDGMVYACDVKRREVMRLDPVSRAVATYSGGTGDRPMVNPNWAAFDSGGFLYVTDSGTWEQNDGWIWRIAPGGAAEVWSTGSTNFPNGCCLDADERHLLVLESLTPALVRIPILADGTAGPREIVTELPGTVPDGIALDTMGRAYICCYEPNRILRVDVDGTIAVVADDPAGAMLVNPTNGMWFGEGLSRFACANLGGIHIAEVSIPDASGIGLRHPRMGARTGDR